MTRFVLVAKAINVHVDDGEVEVALYACGDCGGLVTLDTLDRHRTWHAEPATCDPGVVDLTDDVGVFPPRVRRPRPQR